MVRTSKWSHNILVVPMASTFPSCVLFFSGRFFLNTAKTMDTVDGKNPRRLRLIVTWLATGSYIYLYIYISLVQAFRRSTTASPNHVCSTFKLCIKHIKHPWCQFSLLSWNKIVQHPSTDDGNSCSKPLQLTIYETLHSMDVWNVSFKKLVYFRICPFLQQIHGSVMWKEEFQLIGQTWITKESRRAEPLFVELR